MGDLQFARDSLLVFSNFLKALSTSMVLLR